jgi:hypothetical protein
MSKWSTTHWIGFASLLVAIIGVIAGIILGAMQLAVSISNRAQPTPTVTQTPRTPSQSTPVESASKQTPASGPKAGPSVLPTGKIEELPDEGTKIPTPKVTRTVTSQATPEPMPRRTDIGQKKSNGLYEITLENVTISNSSGQHTCGTNVEPHERAVAVRFTIKALSNSVSAYTRKNGDTDFLIVNQEGRRFERVCGDGWYGWGVRTITLVYVLPTKSEELKFSFQNAGYGDAISFVIPEIQ